MDQYQIVKRPLITEKGNIQKESLNKYLFEVDKRANKIQIKEAVEKLFSVSVNDVRTVIVPGKFKRVGKRVGRRPNWKKAIVTLKEGFNIDFFEGI